MEILEDESITTANTSAGKFFVSSHHPSDETAENNRSTLSMMMAMNVSVNASNLSMEQGSFHSSDHRNGNIGIPNNTRFGLFRDSRHDSPKEDEALQQQHDGDAMMTSEDTSLGNATNNDSGFAPPPPTLRCSHATSSSIPTSSTVGFMRSSADAEGDRVNMTATNTNGNRFLLEEKVSLAPRFGSTPPENADGAESNRQGSQDLDLNSEHLFSISGSMSSEFLDNQHHNPDHQQEYTASHERQAALGMNSPTSTTARDFLREVHGPAIPSMHNSSQGNGILRTRPASMPSFGTPPLPHHTNDSIQRPPFHLQSRINSTPPSSSNDPASTSPPPPPLSTFYKNSSHPTLMREQQPHVSGSSPSSTSYNIPGIGSFCDSSCNGGREKPVISRCFAWSQDSQDERRITKRARMVPDNNHSHVVHVALGSSPHSTDTSGSILSPTSALDIVRNNGENTNAEGGHDHSEEHKSEIEAPSTFAFSRPTGTDTYDTKHGESLGSSMKKSSSPPPTKVHWEEKVENSSELMSHAVAPQVLFGSNSTISSNTRDVNEDVAMGDGEQQNQFQHAIADTNSVPPPITVAHSASHYSFESL